MAPASNKLRFGPFRLDRDAGELYKAGMLIKLQPQPFQLLLLLVDHAGTVVTREEIQQSLWSDSTFVDFEHGINFAINQVRAALADHADNPRYIQTLPRRGYRFIHPVQRLSSVLGEQIAPTVDAVPTAERSSSLDPASVSLRTRTKTRQMLLLTIFGLAILAAAAFTFLGRARSSKAESHDIRALAVLPLESLSRDPSQTYFADGLTDQLITDLSQISSLRVISRTSVMQYKDTRKSLPQIARELNVDAVVEGTILRSGNHVRITTQLIRTPPDRHLWSQSYEGDLSDVLALQERVSSDVATHIRNNLSPQEQAKLKEIRALNADAYDAYLQGRYFESKRSSEDLKKAIEYFQRATQKDPGYALAYVGLARTYHELSFFDTVFPKETNERARTAALKALQLDQGLAEAHTVLASIERDAFEWDATRTENELRQAIQLNPNYAPAHDYYAGLLSAEGRRDESVREGLRALELDPRSLSTGSHLGDVYYFNRQYKQAIEQHRKVLESYPMASEPNQDLTLDYLADGSPGLFLVQAQRWLEVSGEASSKEAAAQLGALKPADYRLALQILIRQALAQRKTAYASAVWIATLYAEDENMERALEWLGKAYDERDPNLLLIGVDPAFDGLRTNSRFQKLSASVATPSP